MLHANKSVFPDLLGKMTVSGATPAHCDDQAMAVAVPTQTPLSAFDPQT
jgi:hypothetical protein